MKKHVMADLETLGTRPGSVILSIGAVRFDVGGVGTAFHEYVDADDSIKCGLTVDASTVMWWMQQNDEARNKICKRGFLLREVLRNFSEWFCGSEYLWGNGAAFDNVLLGAAYDAVGIERPWKFWNDRCYRTVKAEHPHIEPDPFEGIKHDALDDAKHQAKHLIKIWKEVERADKGD